MRVKGKFTEQETDEFIRMAVTLLGSKMYTTSEAADILQIEFGGSRRNTMLLIDRARKKVREELDVEIEDQRSALIKFYKDLIRSDTVSTRERIRAAEALTKLMAISKPPVVAEEAKPQHIELILPDWRSALKDARDKGLLKSAGGNGKKPPGDNGNGSR